MNLSVEDKFRMNITAQWNSEVLQGQSGIPIFTDGSRLGGGTIVVVFCRELSLELHFRLKNDCSVLQAEIFAILKAIEVAVV